MVQHRGISVHTKNFIKFLDRNYCIVAHLTERLDELRESVLFPHLHHQIANAIELLEAQSLSANQVYKALGTSASFTANVQLISFLEHTFSGLPSQDNGSQYACLLDYVSVADALMAESGRLADLSLSATDRLSLPHYQLYQPLTLEPLITALAQAGLVSG